MNWGYKILIVIVLFVLGMSFMVSIAMRQTNELVDEHYYIKELQYQSQIDAQNRLNESGQRVSLKDTIGGILLSLPVEVAGTNAEGMISLLRPSKQSQDRKIPLHLDANGKQLIEDKQLIEGAYRLNISWSYEGLQYCHEQLLYVN